MSNALSLTEFVLGFIKLDRFLFGVTAFSKKTAKSSVGWTVFVALFG